MSGEVAPVDVMARLVLVLGKRQRLWPPDEAACIASVGLLGWMHGIYVPPERVVSEMVGLLWVSGLRGLDDRKQRPKRSLLSGDQLAIDSYAAAVASRLMSEVGAVPSVSAAMWGEADAVRDSNWSLEEYESLCAHGVRHGDALRVLMGEMCARFRGQWHESTRPDLAFPSRLSQEGDEPETQSRMGLLEKAMNRQTDWPFHMGGLGSASAVCPARQAPGDEGCISDVVSVARSRYY